MWNWILERCWIETLTNATKVPLQQWDKTTPREAFSRPIQLPWWLCKSVKPLNLAVDAQCLYAPTNCFIVLPPPYNIYIYTFHRHLLATIDYFVMIAGSDGSHISRGFFSFYRNISKELPFEFANYWTKIYLYFIFGYNSLNKGILCHIMRI